MNKSYYLLIGLIIVYFTILPILLLTGEPLVLPGKIYNGLTTVFYVITFSVVGIALTEVLIRIYQNHSFGNDRDLIIRSITDPLGSGYVLIANSIRMLSYALVISASTIACVN